MAPTEGSDKIVAALRAGAVGFPERLTLIDAIPKLRGKNFALIGDLLAMRAAILFAHAAAVDLDFVATEAAALSATNRRPR